MVNEDFLRKINYIYRQNQLVRLKRENKQKEERIKELSKEGKKLIDDFGQKNKANFDNLNDRIRRLEEENNVLKQETNYYKEVFEKIPSFIRRIFIKEKKTITE